MNKKLLSNLLRIVSVCCALFLFIAVLPNPLKYYWVLRVIVSLGAVLVILKNITDGYWVVLFGVILILFNPIFPIHFYMKLPWIPIDIASGLLFLIEIIINRPKKVKPVLIEKEAKSMNVIESYKRNQL